MLDASTGGDTHQTKHIYYLEIWVGAQGEVIAIASNGHESWELQGRAMGHNMLHCVHRLLWRQAMFTYYKHSYDILLVSNCHCSCSLHWVQDRMQQGRKNRRSRHWLCSPLVLICTMTFNLCVLAPLIRCHELLTLSASFTESTVSTRNRFGTPGDANARINKRTSTLDASGMEGWQSLTQKFVDIILLEMADEVPLDFWTWAQNLEMEWKDCHRLWFWNTKQSVFMWTHQWIWSFIHQFIDLVWEQSTVVNLYIVSNHYFLQSFMFEQSRIFRTHIIFTKVTVPLPVGLHHHVWGFSLADCHEAGRHGRQRLKDNTGSFFHRYQ